MWIDARQAFRLVRFRRMVALRSVRSNSSHQAAPGSSVRSPRDLYAHLERYIVGQERAKRLLSVAVFNHYQRIAPKAAVSTLEPDFSPPPASQQFTSPEVSTSSANRSRPSASTNSPPLHWLEASSSKIINRGRPSELPRPRLSSARDISRSHDLADSTVAHVISSSARISEDSRERGWPRDGYFSSRLPIAQMSDTTPRKRRSLTYLDEDPSASLRDSESAEAGPSSPKRDVPDYEGFASDMGGERPGVDSTSQPFAQSPGPPVEIEKSNVLMIGPTGTGKTLMTKTLARILDVPFASCDATMYTSAGYVGEDVENCILRLLQASDYDVSQTEIGIIHIDEIDKLARRGASDGFSAWSGGRDVGGEGVQQAFLRLLEGTQVTLNAKPPTGSAASAGVGLPGSKSEEPNWDPNNPMNRSFSGKKGVRDGLPGFGSASAGKGETFVVDTSNILFICSGAFVGLEELVNSRQGKGSIGFGAALPTRLADPTDAPSAENSPRSLPLKGLLTRDLQTYGLIPEFLGRLPILSTLHPLSVPDLIRILTEPRNALAKQYQAIFHGYGCDLRFTRKALEAVAVSSNKRGGGARGLRGVLEEILGEAMFEIPGSSVRYCLITEAVAKGNDPAVYYSRGQRFAFLNAIDEEDGVQQPEEDEVEEEERMRAVG